MCASKRVRKLLLFVYRGIDSVYSVTKKLILYHPNPFRDTHCTCSMLGMVAFLVSIFLQKSIPFPASLVIHNNNKIIFNKNIKCSSGHSNIPYRSCICTIVPVKNIAMACTLSKLCGMYFIFLRIFLMQERISSRRRTRSSLKKSDK